MLILSDVNTWYDIALIGVGIIATLIGGIIMKLLESKVNKIGKLSVYYRVIDIYNETNWSKVEIRIQVKNPSHDTKFLRDVALEMKKENKIVRAIPSEKTTHSRGGNVVGTTMHANNGSYSIASESRSLVEYELVYLFESYLIQDDELLLSFVDDNEKKNIIQILPKKNDEWIIAKIYR